MSKLILLFLLISAYIFISSPVLADTSGVSVTQNPSTVTTDTPNLTFTITRKDSTGAPLPFNKSLHYAFILTPKNKSVTESSCRIMADPNVNGREKITISDTDPSSLIVSYSPQYINSHGSSGSCLHTLGLWQLRVFIGTKDSDENSSTDLVSGYEFNIDQAGGQVATITAVNSKVVLGQQPEVQLVNARAGVWYSFWWDGAIINDANRFQATENKNYTITLSDAGSGGFTLTHPYRICMKAEYVYTPATTSCDRYVDFNFVDNAGPDKLSCNMDHPNIAKDDNVGVIIKGAPPKETLKADIEQVSQSAPVLSGSGVSDDRGTATINLSGKLAIGSYTATITKSDNNTLCQIGPFDVSEKSTTGINTATLCLAGDTSCTSSAGQSCDTTTGQIQSPGNGIFTAIGCIPSEPTALIQSLFKFFLGIGGGIALLLMISGGISMMTSSGNQQAVQAARERFTSAAIGLIFIIMAVFLLRVIGVDLLQIIK